MTQTTRRLGVLVFLAAGAVMAVLGVANGLPPSTPKTGMVCTPQNASGPTYDLWADDGHVQTPEGNSIYMWGYQDATGAGNFQSPGPVLCVTEGQTVSIRLHNTLPEASSIVFPGQQGVGVAAGDPGTPGLLTREAAPAGGTVTYTFTALNLKPGTYLYESGSNVSKQVEMGLFGALIVRPNASTCPPLPGTGCAYNGSTRFNQSREYLLLLSEIDPELHHAVELGAGTPYDFTKLHNRYYMINGRAFPDTLQDNGSSLLPTQPYGALIRMQPNSASNTQPALIRMINAGADSHPFHPHGNHTREIAQDGRLLINGAARASTEHFGETIGAGQTIDYLMRWDNQGTDTSGQTFNDNWNPTSNPLPVPQPIYKDLVFKDAVTWYSGNPYLGYKGTLPTGTTSLNVCGEWYFPLHSHALNEFANFNEPFGGMATLLRIDPPGGCATTATSATIISGVLKSGTSTNLLADDAAYFQVNPKTTTRPSASGTMNTVTNTLNVTSAAGFQTAGTYYVRVDNEVMFVTAGQGTTAWTVTRGALGTSAATHADGAVVTALANDWYATFKGVPAGSANLAVTYRGKNCGNTTGTSCTSLTTNLPQQTIKICNWTVAGATGCSTPTSAGWQVAPLTGPAQPQNLGSTEPAVQTWTIAGLGNAFIGTGTYGGQVRVLVHNQRWTLGTPTTTTPFSTWANFTQLAYDAP